MVRGLKNVAGNAIYSILSQIQTREAMRETESYLRNIEI
jgi:hypothetical protein